MARRNTQEAAEEEEEDAEMPDQQEEEMYNPKTDEKPWPGNVEAWDFEGRRRFSKVDYLNDNWYLRLRDGGGEALKEDVELMKKIIEDGEKAIEKEEDWVVPKRLLEKPDDFVDSNDPEDPSSDAFWKKIDDEYWDEATKDISELVELHKDYDAEIQDIMDRKKAMDDIVPPFPGNSWDWEVHRRRKYYDKLAESDPLYKLEKSHAEIFDPIYSDFPLPEIPPDLTPREKVFGRAHVDAENAKKVADGALAFLAANAALRQLGQDPPLLSSSDDPGTTADATACLTDTPS